MTHCAGAWSGGRIKDALHDWPSLSRDCPMFSETEVLSLREAAPRAGGCIPSLLDLHFCGLGQPCPANYMHTSMESLVCGSFIPGSTLALPQGVSIHKMGWKARTRWKGLYGSDGCSGFFLSEPGKSHGLVSWADTHLPPICVRGSLLSPKREIRLHSPLGLSFPTGSASESSLSGTHEAPGFLQEVSVLSLSNSRLPDLGIWAWKRISRGHEHSSDFTVLGQGLPGNGLLCFLPPASQQLLLQIHSTSTQIGPRWEGQASINLSKLVLCTLDFYHTP